MKTDDFRGFPELLRISEASFTNLARHTKESCFAEGQRLIVRGDRVNGVYLVASGALRVYVTDVNGKESTLYNVSPGESCLFSMNCVFSDVSYPAWVSCSAPETRVLSIPSHVYKKLYESEQSVRNFTVNALSLRVFDLMSALEEALSYSLEQRIASLIVRKRDGNNRLKISHQGIASELGTAREVVSRILRQMENAGAVSLARGTVTVLSVEALNAYIS